MQEDIKQWLMLYGDTRRRVERCRCALETAKQQRVEELAGLYVPMPDIGTRVQSGGNSDPTYTITERLIMYHDERVAKAIENLWRAEYELDEVQGVIDRAGLSDVETQYIELRYVRLLTATDTAEQMGYSERRTREIAGNILNIIRNTIDIT